MFKKQVLLTFRQFRKNKVFSFINIFGLSIGLTSALIIFAYVHFELSVDKHHERYGQIFRITEQIKADDGSLTVSANSPARTAYALQDHGIEEIDAIGRLFPFPVFVSEDKISWQKEEKWTFADSTITDIFSIDVVAGSLESALSDPMSAAVTEQAALRIFGTTDILDKVLHYEDESGQFEFSIKAVIENPPATSHFSYSVLASFQSLYTTMPWHISWYHPYLYTYGVLKESANETKVDTLLKAKLHQSLPEWEKENREFALQKLDRIHLHSNLTSEWQSNSRYEYIVIFILIALFILLIACVNFINLSTSKAIRRAKEVGVRKTMGATQQMLTLQFLAESAWLTVSSFIIAFATTEWFLLLKFNEIVGRPLTLSFLYEGWTPIWVAAGLALLSVVSGLYPALVLSSYNAARALRNRVESKETGRFRRILVTVQFAISCFLIAGTMMVVKQVSFMKHSNLGFEKDHIVTVRLNSRPEQINHRQLIDALTQHSEVASAAVSSHIPGAEVLYDNPVLPENSEREDGYNMLTLNVGPEYIDVFQMEMLYGRGFSAETANDAERAVILNESAVAMFGWNSEDAVGRKVQLTWYSDSAQIKNTEVIGVIKDFHFSSLKRKIKPLVMHINTHPYYTEYVSVRFSGSISETMDLLESEWKSFSPERPLEASFLDDELDRLYQSETQASQILSTFAGLAIFISCLGLLGLSAYAAERRTKEIGIRKTMGANVRVIVQLLAKDFLVLIVIGNVIGLPIAAYLSFEWLSNFAYRTSMDWWIFVVTPLLAMLIGFLTVSYQSIKAAIADPVKSLKED